MIRYINRINPKLLHGTALVRLDFNTEDDWRMRAVLPTLKFLLAKSDKVIVISHKGRPKSARDTQWSLKKDGVTLGKLLGKKVTFIPHLAVTKIAKQVAESPRGSLFLLENLRFNPGEEKNDATFAKQLASLADFYVNDAFAVSHRANASLVAITKYLPSYAGLEMEKEILFLSHAIKKPKRPLVFIVGGAKATDKLDAITYFRNRTDWFLLGGGLANTILMTEGMQIKKSVHDEDPKDIAALRRFSKANNVLIPTDFKWHKDFIWDIGPKTIATFAKKIASARTILWAGPLGMIEKKEFARGSVAIGKAIIKNRKALSITGGGETVMFLKKYGLDKKFTFVSTGGGALIDFLAGKALPGVVALQK
jgi:3-phosphoglycerate kinase